MKKKTSLKRRDKIKYKEANKKVNDATSFIFLVQCAHGTCRVYSTYQTSKQSTICLTMPPRLILWHRRNQYQVSLASS